MGPLVWKKAKCNCLTRHLGRQQIQTLQLSEGQNELVAFLELRTRSGLGNSETKTVQLSLGLEPMLLIEITCLSRLSEA